MEKRIKKGCPTFNCKGILYIKDYTIKCTECSFETKAKRETDTHLMSFNQLKNEFNS